MFEIDASAIASSIVEPIAALLRSPLGYVHQHDGHQTTIHGIVDPAAFASELIKLPLRAGVPVAHGPPAPAISQELKALVCAVRDSELLIPSVPKGCVVHSLLVP